MTITASVFRQTERRELFGLLGVSAIFANKWKLFHHAPQGKDWQLAETSLTAGDQGEWMWQFSWKEKGTEGLEGKIKSRGGGRKRNKHHLSVHALSRKAWILRGARIHILLKVIQAIMPPQSLWLSRSYWHYNTICILPDKETLLEQSQSSEDQAPHFVHRYPKFLCNPTCGLNQGSASSKTKWLNTRYDCTTGVILQLL